jgi:predicted adenine nucleotide alpha hydrolase (AANH) superfamily ATPase
VEKLAKDGAAATLFFHNPNIYPRGEYERRKAEVVKIAGLYKMPLVDTDYRHGDFTAAAKGLEHCPERGGRCAACFLLRLSGAAKYARENGFDSFASTLAFSRWKSFAQVAEAGAKASAIYGVPYLSVDWRKSGLPARAREIVAERGIYRQDYCGCEYSAKTARRA